MTAPLWHHKGQATLGVLGSIYFPKSSHRGLWKATAHCSGGVQFPSPSLKPASEVHCEHRYSCYASPIAPRRGDACQPYLLEQDSLRELCSSCTPQACTGYKEEKVSRATRQNRLGSSGNMLRQFLCLSLGRGGQPLKPNPEQFLYLD